LAAAREAREETGLTKDDLRFYPHAVCVTDAIYKSGGGEKEAVQFHYVITHQVLHTHTHTHTHTSFLSLNSNGALMHTHTHTHTHT
jgi:8-oxo-dGTP pyrophosphatase MutT (NUDIX family)